MSEEKIRKDAYKKEEMDLYSDSVKKFGNNVIKIAEHMQQNCSKLQPHAKELYSKFGAPEWKKSILNRLRSISRKVKQTPRETRNVYSVRGLTPRQITQRMQQFEVDERNDPVAADEHDADVDDNTQPEMDDNDDNEEQQQSADADHLEGTHADREQDADALAPEDNNDEVEAPSTSQGKKEG